MLLGTPNLGNVKPIQSITKTLPELDSATDLRTGILIAGILLGILGLFLVDVLIGLPMMLFGFVLFLYGLFASEQRGRGMVQFSYGPPVVTSSPPVASLYCPYGNGR